MATDYEATVAMEIEKTQVPEEDTKDENKKEAVDAKPEDNPADSNNESLANDDDNDDDDDDDDDEDLSSTSSDDSDKDFSPKQDPEVLIIKGTSLKEEGNNFFKGNNYEAAARCYRRGVNAVKSLNKQNTGDAQVKGLLVSLQTNLSMVCFKQEKYKLSCKVASGALKVENCNVKALYRRAVAHRKLGDLEAARADLRAAVKVDSSNVSVRKELAAVKKQIEDTKAQQKKGLAKAFSKGSSLYDDKEEEKRRKEEESKQQKKLQEEALKKRKVLWEDECVKRMARGDPALSFEEWDKERETKEKEEKKKKREEEKRLKEERRKARAAAKKDESDSDDDELTEKELSQLRGYKKTADGRVTSYFTREQSQAEKNLIGSIAPKRLEPTATAAGVPAQVSPASSGEGAGPSAWNQSGSTWEERDVSDWCRSRLKYRLKETKVENVPAIAVVTDVENMTGEASVAIAGGKKRYIFDFHCKVVFDVRDADDDEVLATGTLKLPDICSTHHEELELVFAGWKKSPNGDREQQVSDCRLALCTEVRESVKLWVADFNAKY